MRRERGFTLLEVLVATTIMAIAVTALLASMSTSLRNAARLTENDRAALLARRQMDELLISQRLPRMAPFEASFDPALTGGVESGWRARVTPFEMPPGAAPGAAFLERIELVVWWKAGDETKTFSLEAFRTSVLTGQDLAAGVRQQ